MFPVTKNECITRRRSNQRSDELWWPILTQAVSSANRFTSKITLGIIVLMNILCSEA